MCTIYITLKWNCNHFMRVIWMNLIVRCFVYCAKYVGVKTKLDVKLKVY